MQLIRQSLALWIGLGMLVHGAHAELTLEDVRSAPSPPEQFYSLSLAEKKQWIEQQLKMKTQPAEQYVLKRVLFYEEYFANQQAEAAALCQSNQPLREDIYYREHCILASHPNYEEFSPLILQLVHDARQFGLLRAAAQVLSNFAWRQSQAGDVAAAFESYETALSVAPAEAVDLINTIMMDTASNYIVNGDEQYVVKGINLLQRVKSQSQQALQDPDNKVDDEILMENILLADFNTGIAYLLHLHQAKKALPFFIEVAKTRNDFQSGAITFAALAAAEVGDYAQAKTLLQRYQVDPQGYYSSKPIVQAYLTCYQQLTRRFWDAQQSLEQCFSLDPETTMEVLLDVYKRLAKVNDPAIEMVGLRKLTTLYANKIEPQLRRRGARAASNTELARLQRESELKSVVLEQQKALQVQQEETHTQRMRYFTALFLLTLMVALLVFLQFRQKKKLADQFERLSTKDTLTGLGNRRYFEQHITREFRHIDRLRHQNAKASLGIYLFDIDHFKLINDRHGHHAGDEVLIEFGRRLSAVTRETDLLVRWGGEEFVLLARLDNDQQAALLADRLLTAINAQAFLLPGDARIDVSCTIGIVQYPFVVDDKVGWSQLLSLADGALYEGKSQGRNTWRWIRNLDVPNTEQFSRLLSTPLSDAMVRGWIAIIAGGQSSSK